MLRGLKHPSLVIKWQYGTGSCLTIQLFDRMWKTGKLSKSSAYWPVNMALILIVDALKAFMEPVPLDGWHRGRRTVGRSRARAQAGHAEWDSSSQSLAMRLVLNQHPTWLSSSVQSCAHAHRTQTHLELSCNCMASHLASLQPSNHFHWSIWHKQISQMRPEERYLKTWT